nr:AAA family ATPase [bacterium]
INYLKEYIVGQHAAMEMVATKICTHFHRMQLERDHPDLKRIVGHIKSNILVIGPTGVGKTYLIKLIANKLRVPFVKGDATKFSETGYVGGDVEDLIRELVHQVGGNIKLAEYGIVYIDEIDKIASSGSSYGPDVSRSGVQRNLLKLMEETEVDMKVPHDLASQMESVMETQRTGKAVRKKVNTRNILFIMSGAFVDLGEIIARRLKRGGYGFTGEILKSKYEIEFLFKYLQSLDLIEYGFESEFIGRIPVTTHMDGLDEISLFEILRNPKSAVVLGKKRDFAAYGIELSFSEDALRYIARKATSFKTGARGLVSAVESILMPFERSLPSTKIPSLLVTKELCENAEEYLADLITSHAFEYFSEYFLEENNIQIDFSPAAKTKAEGIAASMGARIGDYLAEILKNFDYGLKLLGKSSFTVTGKVLNNPQGYLDNLVKKSYSNETD